METKYASETGKITVTMQLSEAHAMSDNGLSLWLTPGSSRPYWASRASFTYDRVVAQPEDFLDALGYDDFGEDPDYDANDEAATVVVDWIDPAPYMRK